MSITTFTRVTGSNVVPGVTLIDTVVADEDKPSLDNMMDVVMDRAPDLAVVPGVRPENLPVPVLAHPPLRSRETGSRRLRPRRRKNSLGVNPMVVVPVP